MTRYIAPGSKLTPGPVSKVKIVFKGSGTGMTKIAYQLANFK